MIVVVEREHLVIDVGDEQIDPAILVKSAASTPMPERAWPSALKPTSA